MGENALKMFELSCCLEINKVNSFKNGFFKGKQLDWQIELRQDDTGQSVLLIRPKKTWKGFLFDVAIKLTIGLFSRSNS